MLKFFYLILYIVFGAIIHGVMVRNGLTLWNDYFIFFWGFGFGGIMFGYKGAEKLH